MRRGLIIDTLPRPISGASEEKVHRVGPLIPARPQLDDDGCASGLNGSPLEVLPFGVGTKHRPHFVDFRAQSFGVPHVQLRAVLHGVHHGSFARPDSDRPAEHDLVAGRQIDQALAGLRWRVLEEHEAEKKGLDAQAHAQEYTPLSAKF